MRETGETDVDGGPLHLALRELRDVAGSKKFWTLAGSIGLILGLTGPFSTFEQLPPIPRLGYWLTVSVATYLTGIFFVTLLRAAPPINRMQESTALLAAGAVAGIPITVVVFVIGRVSLPDGRASAAEFGELMLYCMLISGLVAATNGLVMAWREPAPQQRRVEPAEVPLMRRLPPEKRGRLLRIAVTDHYVEIHTDRGAHLALMRLADAIDETGAIHGLQVHRSHWVARHAVTCAFRRSGRTFVRLSDGSEVPLSRSRIEDAKALGWFA